jgi:hypothetical protein
MKVKVFLNEGNIPALEREINKWLTQNPGAVIHHIKQSYAFDNEETFYTLLTIWYGERKAAAQGSKASAQKTKK